jgi:biopolymer transport protein TolR
MGASMQGGSPRSRARGRRYQPMAEINVTPFVDVMLVLLIIFMVAAPLLTVGVPIELPKTEASALKAEKEPIAITVQPDGKIFLQETEIALDEIAPKLTAIAQSGYDETIFIRGDRNANYGQLMRVMGRISAAGFKRISLITEQEQQERR